MSRCVTISRVKCCNQRRGEGEVGPLEPFVRVEQIVGQSPLLLIESEQLLRSKSRYEEQEEREWREFPIGDRKNGDERAIERNRGQDDRSFRSNQLHDAPVSTQLGSDGSEDDI